MSDNLRLAIDMLIAEYEGAKGTEWVEKPVAYALSQVWKWFDGKGRKANE